MLLQQKLEAMDEMDSGKSLESFSTECEVSATGICNHKKNSNQIDLCA